MGPLRKLAVRYSDLRRPHAEHCATGLWRKIALLLFNEEDNIRFGHQNGALRHLMHVASTAPLGSYNASLTQFSTIKACDGLVAL
jgi:hypothetical protein